MSVTLNKSHLAQLSVAPNHKKLVELLHLYEGYQLNIPSVIKSYHDLLLFYCAFPFNVDMVEQANAELKRIAAQAKAIGNNSNEKTKNALLATGIAHTKVICCYSSAIANWLVKKFPDDVELDSSEASKDAVRNILQALAPAIEYENTSQGELGLIERLKLLYGLQHPTDLLKYLLRQFENSELPLAVREILYQELKVFIGWQLSNDLFNRSFLRWPVKKIYLQKTLIKNVNSISILKQKIASPVSLSAADKIALMDTIKASLAFQYRETDAVTYADMDELELFDLGRGLQVALVGMIKGKRL
ncbi:MAG TPA: hypothetical protein VLR49_11720, partial [Ferruginibacter sp.]|nr:hypothetical protein [Ferruginibacter sp.]